MITWEPTSTSLALLDTGQGGLEVSRDMRLQHHHVLQPVRFIPWSQYSYVILHNVWVHHSGKERDSNPEGYDAISIGQQSRWYRGSFLPPSSEYSKVLCSLRTGLHMLVNQQESLKPVGRKETSKGLFNYFRQEILVKSHNWQQRQCLPEQHDDSKCRNILTFAAHFPSSRNSSRMKNSFALFEVCRCVSLIFLLVVYVLHLVGRS